MTVMYCPVCHKQIQSTFMKCPYCSTSFNQGSLKAKNTEHLSFLRKVKKWLVNTLSALGVIFILFIIWTWNITPSNSSDSKKSDNDVKSSSITVEADVSKSEDIEIPMPKSGYQGKYFLISHEKNKNIHVVTYRSSWIDETVFTKEEINCKTKQYRRLGEGIDSIENLTMYQDLGKWANITKGGSSDDVVSFICSRK